MSKKFREQVLRTSPSLPEEGYSPEQRILIKSYLWTVFRREIELIAMKSAARQGVRISPVLRVHLCDPQIM